MSPMSATSRTDTADTAGAAGAADDRGRRRHARRRPSGGRRWLPIVVVSVVYLVLATFAYAHTAFAGGSRLPICACGDQVQEVWFLRWPMYAIAHGLNPLFTTWMNYPGGANLALNTSAPLLGMVSIPLQLTVGPVATYNLLLVLALASSALSLCLVLRRWISSWGARFAGGLLYGFSAYMVGQGNGHLFLTAAFIPPLVLLVLDEIVVRRRYPPRRLGLMAGVLVIAQYLISPEVLAMTAIIAACGLVVLAIFNRGEVRAVLPGLAVAGAYCASLAAVVLAYPIWFSLAGPQHVIGPPHRLSDLARYPGDLLGPILPTSSQHFGTAALRLRGNGLSGGSPVENGLYLGIPLLAVLATLTWVFRRSRLLLFFGAMAVVSFVLALGPRLTIDGHDTGIRLPFTVLRHVPMIQSIEPVRFSLFVQLFAGATLALGLDLLVRRLHGGASERKGTPRRFLRVTVPALVVGAVALLPLVPQLPYAGAPTDVPAFYSGPGVQRIPAASVVLAYPYPVTPTVQAMLGQAVAGMRFKLVGGDAFVPGADGRSTFGPPVLPPSVVQAIFYNAYAPSPVGPPSRLGEYPPINPGTVGGLRTFLVRYDIGTVVIDPVGVNPGAALRYVTATLGPGQRVGGVVVWYGVPRLLRTRN